MEVRNSQEKESGAIPFWRHAGRREGVDVQFFAGGAELVFVAFNGVFGMGMEEETQRCKEQQQRGKDKDGFTPPRFQWRKCNRLRGEGNEKVGWGLVDLVAQQTAEAVLTLRRREHPAKAGC